MIGGRDDGSAGTGMDPWRRLDARGSLEDLAFPDGLMRELTELCQMYRARAGGNSAGGEAVVVQTALMLLFEGPSGSGKTSAAMALAATLGLAAIEVDSEALLAAGPATVARLLGQAAARPLLLVLDGAEHLLSATKPDDAAIVLGRLRAVVTGVVIACIERRRDVASPGLQRFDRRLVFTAPDARARAAIWHRCLPPESGVPATEIAFIARAFRLSGHEICACASAAADTARRQDATLSLVHLAGSLSETYRGRLVSEATRVAIRELGDRAALGAIAPALDVPRVPARRSAVTPGRVVQRGAPATYPARRWAVALVALGVIAAVGLALALSGHRSSPPAPLDRHASAGPIRLSYPANWTARLGSARGLASVLVLSSRSGRLEVGWSASAAAGILSRFVSPTAAPTEVVTLGGHTFDRVLALRDSGEAVYARAGGDGTAVAICRTTSRAFASDCERVLATLLIARAPAAPTTTQLAAILVTLNRARGALGAELNGARDAGQQAQVATQLASAHASAASAVASLSSASADEPLVTALRTVADAYSALALAARRQNPGAYRDASRTVQSADTTLMRLLATLRSAA